MSDKLLKGRIGVTTENIFPVIKQFLYSDHEIFLREIVANAVDATRKMKALASSGDFKGELGELKVNVELDEKEKVLRISDRGIGMTEKQILFKVQLPLALPVIMAGIRVAAVNSMGTATIAAFIGGGGLGKQIYAGIQIIDTNMILSGAIPACLLALLMDFLFGLIEKSLVPVSLRVSSSLLNPDVIARMKRRKKLVFMKMRYIP